MYIKMSGDQMKVIFRRKKKKNLLFQILNMVGDLHYTTVSKDTLKQQYVTLEGDLEAP